MSPNMSLAGVLMAYMIAKNGRFIANRFYGPPGSGEAFNWTNTHTHAHTPHTHPHTHTHTHHTHTHTHHTHTHMEHTPMNAIGENAMCCLSLKNQDID